MPRRFALAALLTCVAASTCNVDVDPPDGGAQASGASRLHAVPNPDPN